MTRYLPDILHDIFEGIVLLELGLCFSVFISKKYFTFSELNSAIAKFPYKWADKTVFSHCLQPSPHKRRLEEMRMKIGPSYNCCRSLLDTKYL